MATDPLIEISDIPRALGLLSRLPVRVNPGAAELRGARAAWAWPVAGAVIGGLGALPGWGALALDVPPGAAAALVLGTLAMMTGALHEDGLADTADGLWGGAEPERRLEIMKDSRIGAYGVLALILVTLARWSALTSLLSAGWVFAPIIGASVLSRVPMVVLLQGLPAARPGGLGASQGLPGASAVRLALGIGGLVGLLTLGAAVIPAVLAATFATVLLASTARARIGGQTGDILGASQQLADLAVLTCAAAMV